MKTRTIKQTVEFKARPGEIYECIMNSKKHSAFTHSWCRIGRSVGDKFTAYDGYIEGENLQLVPGRKIVQSWRASDWPQDHYSEVIFEFETSDNGTTLRFTHKKVPEEFADEISEGWKEHYWEKLKKEFFS